MDYSLKDKLKRPVRVVTEDGFHMNLTEPFILKVKRLVPAAMVPTRGSPGAVGYDLSAVSKTMIGAGERRKIPIGIAVAVPEGFYGRVAPRSGLADNHGIDVLAGVIDPDYRGEVKVILINHGYEALWIQPGQRIAQLIIERVGLPDVEEVDDLDETVRGDKGFGSSGA